MAPSPEPRLTIPGVSGWLTERSRNGGIDEVALPDGAAGKLWLCGKHLIGPDPDGTLERTGASVVVCLNEENELAHRYDEYVAWLKANAATGKAHWYPIHDMHAPSLDDLVALIAQLRTRLDSGDGIVVHCGAGIGRAGTIAAAILISHGMAVDEALTHLRASRLSAGPQTSAQERILEEFAAHIAH